MTFYADDDDGIIENQTKHQPIRTKFQCAYRKSVHHSITASYAAVQIPRR